MIVTTSLSRIMGQGRSLSRRLVAAAGSVTAWILATGAWNDAGVWDDSATWSG